MNAAPAFSRLGALALIVIGFAVFIALLYLIAEGDSMNSGRGDGEAHAAGTGLNGYAGLVRLLEAEGYDVSRSRSPAGLETESLLVLTPPPATDPEELGELLRNRENIGPTLVILPKWSTLRPPPTLPSEARDKFKPGWVILGDAYELEWTAKLPAPYAFDHKIETLEADEEPDWDGFGFNGRLPTRTVLYTSEKDIHEPLLVDATGHWLALKVLGEEGSAYYEDAHWTLFLAEPDLANNYGLADSARAAAAIALVREVGYTGDRRIIFDMTLNGYGGSVNLLTLAFRPPFLAATLCLLMALFIIGWRAFRRFGPAATSGPYIAYGKRQLVANGAGLIVRARRFGLLTRPYAALAARRAAHRLGLPRAEPDAIDAAIARRLPGEEPFTHRAARLEAATRPADILTAAQALDELTGKLKP